MYIHMYYSCNVIHSIQQHQNGGSKPALPSLPAPPIASVQFPFHLSFRPNLANLTPRHITRSTGRLEPHHRPRRRCNAKRPRERRLDPVLLVAPHRELDDGADAMQHEKRGGVPQRLGPAERPQPDDVVERHERETREYAEGFCERDGDAVGGQHAADGVVGEGAAGAGEAGVPAAGPEVVDGDGVVERAEEARGGRVAEEAVEGFEDDVNGEQHLDGDDGRVVLRKGVLEEGEKENVQHVVLELGQAQVRRVPRVEKELAVHRAPPLLLHLLALPPAQLLRLNRVLAFHRRRHQGHVRRGHEVGREGLISELEDIGQRNECVARYWFVSIDGEDVTTADEQIHGFHYESSDFPVKKRGEKEGWRKKGEDRK